LQQVRINEHTQLSAVTKRRHAVVGLGNLSKAVSTVLPSACVIATSQSFPTMTR
jgi:hypothetical protein